MRNLLVLGAAAFAALAPIAAQADVYDAVADFTLANPSSAWSYGSGAGAASFTAFTLTTSSCQGTAGFSCHYSGDYLGVGLNTTGGDIDPFGTAFIPNDVLWLHPADGGGASDTVVRFTAATAGTYSLAAEFSRLSKPGNDGSGNGVDVAIFKNGDSLFAGSLGTISTDVAAYASTVSLGAGDVLSFVVNNNGNYQFDSTGLSATITAVPEAGTWALMIAGFGLTGTALRRRRSLATA